MPWQEGGATDLGVGAGLFPVDAVEPRLTVLSRMFGESVAAESRVPACLSRLFSETVVR